MKPRTEEPRRRALTEEKIKTASASELRNAYRDLLAEAQRRREKTSQSVHEAFDERREQSLKLGGYTPYGYAADDDGKLRRHRREQKMIGLILAMRREKRSLRDISDALADRGFLARCNKPLQAKQIARLIRLHEKNQEGRSDDTPRS